MREAGRVRLTVKQAEFIAWQAEQAQAAAKYKAAQHDAYETTMSVQQQNGGPRSGQPVMTARDVRPEQELWKNYRFPSSEEREERVKRLYTPRPS